jgi:hypothetical protein
MDKNNDAFCMQVRRQKIREFEGFQPGRNTPRRGHPTTLFGDHSPACFSQQFAAGFYEEKPRREAHQIQPIASLKMKGRVSVH